MVSAFSSVADSGTKQQWDDKKKKHCIVSYLEMVNWYNDSIGGINLQDMLNIPSRYLNKKTVVFENHYTSLQHQQRKRMATS